LEAFYVTSCPDITDETTIVGAQCLALPGPPNCGSTLRSIGSVFTDPQFQVGTPEPPTSVRETSYD